MTEQRTVIDEIAAERRRQIEIEEWSSDHDDDHTDGSLAAAAAAYAYHASLTHPPKHLESTEGTVSILDRLWPRSWSAVWWKPRGRRRNLVRAAALIVAEIERLDRTKGALVQTKGE